jgi:Protein of unknown function (DUF4199)
MWTIGVKSGLITLLGLIAYGLVVELMGLHYLLQSNLAHVVLALGIYSGHYYYKAVNHGLMTYRQGLKLGLIITSFVGLVNALSVYLYTKLIDASLIAQLTEEVQDTLRKKYMEEAITEEIVLFMQHMSPELLLIGILVSIVLLGFVFTTVIAAFSRYPRRPHKHSFVPSS